MLTVEQLALNVMLLVLVVPALVRHKLSNCIVITYVMLDNHSQDTFM